MRFPNPVLAHLRAPIVVLSAMLVLALLAAGPAPASDAAKRARLMKELDANMNELLEATVRARAHQQSAARNALRQGSLRITRIKRNLRDLYRLENNDAAALERAETWPRKIRDYEASWKRLERLLGLRNGFDDLDDACKRSETKLRSVVQRSSDTRVIVRAAQKLGRPVADRVAKIPRWKREMEGDVTAIRRFEAGRGVWRKLRDALRTTARGALQYADDRVDEVKEACGDLAKEEEHPAVLAAIGQHEEIDQQRLRLLAQGDTLLEEIVDVLEGGFEFDRDDRRLRAASRLAAKVDPLMRKLARVAGDERVARLRVREWPGSADGLEAALRSLADLKREQFQWDELAPRCTRLEQELRFLILDHTRGAGKPEGIFDLPDWGDVTGAEVDEDLGRAKADRDLVGGKAGLVERFAPADGWEGVAEVVHDLGNQIFVYVDERVTQAEKACDKLALGSRHPEIEKAVAKLSRFSHSSLNLLNAEIGAWIRASQKIFGLQCETLEELWKDYCSIDAEENELLDGSVLASFRAGFIASDIDDKIDDILHELKPVQDRADSLMDPAQPKDVQTKARALFGAAIERRDKLIDIRKQYVDLKGNQHPLKQFATRYGIQQHKRMSSSEGCDVADKKIGNGRPDCIVADECMVLEFKPDDPAAEAKGREQLFTKPGYVPQAERYYSQFLPVGGTPRNVPPSSLGGERIMRKLQDAGCIDDGTVELDGKVETYKVCAMPYTCDRTP
ncbi:MAG: FUSC family protein [Holophagales bacterium]|nr:FUSC family protein [Holophagales bacterium]